jgi:hypothetical protein
MTALLSVALAEASGRKAAWLLPVTPVPLFRCSPHPPVAAATPSGGAEARWNTPTAESV